MKKSSKKPNHTTGELHPRNSHRTGYDFDRLVKSSPELNRFLQQHPLAGQTIDFADPAAVIALNRALLKSHYGVVGWHIPPGYLCPPVPSRADYLHYLADLLADTRGGEIPRGPMIKVLDIGVGANCVYPLIGAKEYGWSFVGTELDATALAWAGRLSRANPDLAKVIELRLQPTATAMFEGGVVRSGEGFAASMCNPPFHSSLAEAAAATERKLRNLNGDPPGKAVLNFGGRGHELWAEGGEGLFIRRMIGESSARPDLCVWFTSLVSKRASLPEIERALAKARTVDVRTISMFAGQKQSRMVAWTFLSPDERRSRLAGVYD